MFSYIAFKALRMKKQKWISPVMGTPWEPKETPWGVFLSASASAAHVDAGAGIFASDYEEASGYGSDIFAVFPDPTGRVVLGTSGWRAEKAYVFGKMESPAEAARCVAAAYKAGYPQVPDIAFWAAVETREPSMAVVIDEYTNKLMARKNNLALNIKAVKAAVEALCKIGDAAAEKLMRLLHDVDETLSFIITTLPAANFSVAVQLAVLRAVMTRIRELGSPEMYMRVAGTLHKYPPEIVQAVLDEFTEHQPARIRRALVLNATKGQSTLLIMERLINDKNELVRCSVAENIGMLGEDGVPILKFMAEKEDDVSILKNLAIAACQIGDPAGDIIKKMMYHPDRNIRAQVALYVNGLYKDALFVLETLSDDPEWIVRNNVARNCDIWGKIAEKILQKLVVDINSTVAISAIHTVARLGLFDILVEVWDIAPDHRWIIASAVRHRVNVPNELMRRVMSWPSPA